MTKRQIHEAFYELASTDVLRDRVEMVLLRGSTGDYEIHVDLDRLTLSGAARMETFARSHGFDSAFAGGSVVLKAFPEDP